jgi:hypothetical protein
MEQLPCQWLRLRWPPQLVPQASCDKKSAEHLELDMADLDEIVDGQGALLTRGEAGAVE